VNTLGSVRTNFVGVADGPLHTLPSARAAAFFVTADARPARGTSGAFADGAARAAATSAAADALLVAAPRTSGRAAEAFGPAGAADVAALAAAPRASGRAIEAFGPGGAFSLAGASVGLAAAAPRVRGRDTIPVPVDVPA
jgi:hypothetical protein